MNCWRRPADPCGCARALAASASTPTASSLQPRPESSERSTPSTALDSQADRIARRAGASEARDLRIVPFPRRVLRPRALRARDAQEPDLSRARPGLPLPRRPLHTDAWTAPSRLDPTPSSPSSARVTAGATSLRPRRRRVHHLAPASCASPATTGGPASAKSGAAPTSPPSSTPSNASCPTSNPTSSSAAAPESEPRPLRRDGSLADDFEIAHQDRLIHILNAPSPGATASLLIGEEIAATATSSWLGG